jgi:predicted O-methyltransferase YrrM
MSLDQEIIYPEAIQESVFAYMNSLLVKETAGQRKVREKTIEAGLPQIDVRPHEGYMLMWMARAIGAKTIVEIGTLAGYSGIWFAKALPTDGKLITMEYSEKHAAIAQRNIEEAGVAHLVEIVIGDAHENLRKLTGPFDLVFIDAEKPGYLDYLEWALENVRVGGLIIGHNALRHGKVTQNPASDEAVAIMQEFNKRMAEDPRLLTTIFPQGDGTIMGIMLG